MLQVKRAGHSTLTTPDIGRMVDYFTRIVGLSPVSYTHLTLPTIYSV